MADDIVPSGCRWCGVDDRGHYQRYSDVYRATERTPVGWHFYEPPTQHQIRTRMRARRAARKDNHRG